MKSKLIVTAVVLTILAALGVAGFAFAQQGNPAGPSSGYGMMGGGYGMMGGRGGMMGGGAGMMGGNYGPMHTYMVSAFAEELGLTAEEVQSRIETGETMWEIALSQGLTEEQIASLMTNAHSKALEQAVAAGVLTQEQADWMYEHMSQMHTNGFGPGSCHGGSTTNGTTG
jgi:hypothetical protein